MTVAGVSGPKSSAFAEVLPRRSSASSLLWGFPAHMHTPCIQINNQPKGGEEKAEEAGMTRREAFDDQIVIYAVVFQRTLEFSMYKDRK